MATRRTFLIAGLSSAASVVASKRRAAAQSAAAQSLVAAPPYILGAAAVTEVFGDGQRLVAVAVEYNQRVASAALNPALYAIEGRTVTRVYANAVAELAQRVRKAPSSSWYCPLTTKPGFSTYTGHPQTSVAPLRSA